MRTWCLILCLLGLTQTARPDAYTRQPAVDIIHYRIELELSDSTDVIKGSVLMRVQARQELARMWLDFETMTAESVRAGGKDLPFTHLNGRLAFDLDRGYAADEIASVAVKFQGRPGIKGITAGRNRHGRRVFFAENWPDSAHHWFPCIDHPSDKATVETIVTAPAKYDVVATGRLLESRSLLDGRKRFHWSEQAPVPAYCMVFAAAEFSIAHQPAVDGVPLVFYAFPQDAAAAASVFARSDLAMRFFSRIIAPFPYEKLAQVEAAVRIGGMENSSAIFYAEALFQQPAPAEGPVVHEIAHQWFGDSVTPADWDHVWLSEGFATYFDALFREHVEGAEALERAMRRSAESVKAFHKNRPGPVVDPSIREPARKLNALAYHKGAWFLHMLRKAVGEEAFRRGIREYYDHFQGRCATTDDFREMMEAAGGRDLGAFFRQWLYQPGWPEYRVTVDVRPEQGRTEITIEQAQTTGLFDMPLDVVLRFGNRRDARTFRVSGESHTFRIPSTEHPTSVEIDPEGWVLKSVVQVKIGP